MADCSIPEAPLRVRDEEDLIHAEYSCGSLVWARLAGWPWWPAMVDDCPDVEQYYWLDGFSDIPVCTIISSSCVVPHRGARVTYQIAGRCGPFLHHGYQVWSYLTVKILPNHQDLT